MALTKDYPILFEQAWKAYPTWPTGRSVKQKAFTAWKSAANRNEWTIADREQLIEEIKLQAHTRASWQRGDKYGPQGMQVWLNSNGWDHEYETTKGKLKSQRGGPAATPWDIRGITQVEWEAEQSWIAKQNLGLPQQYESIEAAMSAARTTH